MKCNIIYLLIYSRPSKQHLMVKLSRRALNALTLNKNHICYQTEKTLFACSSLLVPH